MMGLVISVDSRLWDISAFSILKLSLSHTLKWLVMAMKYDGHSLPSEFPNESNERIPKDAFILPRDPTKSKKPTHPAD